MLGHHICLRLESSGQFSDGVTGICSDDPIQLNHSFINPLGREFPAGYTCFVSDDVICIPGWGAAFLTAVARKAFINRYSPIVSRQWA
jgi:hypothetical protein